MPEEPFETDLLRVIVAELWVSLSLQAAPAMFGKTYVALSSAEKAAVDQWVFGQVGAGYQVITPEWVRGQKVPQPVGFQAQSASPTPKS